MRYKNSIMLVIITLISLSITACSGSRVSTENKNVQTSNMGMYSNYADVGSYDQASGDVVEEIAREAHNEQKVQEAQATQDSKAVENSQKLIRKVGLEIQIDSDKELDSTVRGIKELIGNNGGYITLNDMSFKTAYAGGCLRANIPKDKVDTFLETVKEFNIKIYNINDSSEDVTLMYVDTQARLDVKRAEKEKYQSYLESATNVDEILKIEDRLNQVISDIESYQATINSMNNQIDYTEVTMNISCDTSVDKESFGEVFKKRMVDIWEQFGYNLINGFEILLTALSVLLYLLPIMYIVIRVLFKAIEKGVVSMKKESKRSLTHNFKVNKEMFRGFKGKKTNELNNKNEAQNKNNGNEGE